MSATIICSSDSNLTTLDDLPVRLPILTDGVVWIDITGPSEDDVRLMHDVFHFHPLAIEDTRNIRQRPKVEEFAEYLFFILNPVALHETDTLFCELDVFVGRNYVVSVHNDHEPVIDEVKGRIERGNPSPPNSPGYIMYLLIDAVVDSYFPVLDRLEEEIDNLGDQILSDPSQMILNRLFELKRSSLDLWRVVWPQREILNNLRDHHLALINQEQLMPYFRDITDHLMWIADMVGTFRDTLTSIIDLYMSAVSNRLNRVVNRLTVFTVIIGVMTVIGGFYGMNFEHTWPPFSSVWGVPFVIFMMTSVTVALLYFFRRMKWF